MNDIPILPQSGQKMMPIREFLWKQRFWFIIPFVVTLLCIAVLLIIIQSQPVIPFLYSVL